MGDVRTTFRKLVTSQFMPDFDYRTRFSFQTLFYISDFSYRCCPCGFKHEFLDYIAENGEINENMYGTIIQSIIDGKCPHVSDEVPEYQKIESSVPAVSIAIAVETGEVEQKVADDEAHTNDDDDPMNVYRWLPEFNRTNRKYGIFNIQLHDIALMKKKFNRVIFHCQNYIQYNKRLRSLNRYFSLRATFTNSTVVFKTLKFMEAIVQTNNKALLADVLEVRVDTIEHDLILMSMDLNPLTSMHFVADAFCFAIKHGLTELHDTFLKYFRANTSRSEFHPDSLQTMVEHTIVYNRPPILEELLKIVMSDTAKFCSQWNALSGANAVLHVFNRPDCRKIFRKNGHTLRNDLTFSEMNRITKTYYADFKDEISKAIKRMRNNDAFFRQLFRGMAFIDLHYMKWLLELNVPTDVAGTFRDNFSESVFETLMYQMAQVFRWNRLAAKLLVEENFDSKFSLSDIVTIDNDIVTIVTIDNAIVTFDDFIRREELDFIVNAPYWKTFQDRGGFSRPQDVIFRTDTKEHGRLGFEGQGFALNFTAPFLLECGWPTTRNTLEKYLTEQLHPSEIGYFRDYIQENFDGPKPLAKICRCVLRMHFKGRQLHKFLDITGCPQLIKDYILLKHLLN